MKFWALAYLLGVQFLFAAASTDYLRNRIPVRNHRYETFRYVLELLDTRGVETMVETGTARDGASNFIGDGGSTIIFSEWARDHDVDFYSIDIDEKNISRSRSAVDRFVLNQKEKIHFICSDSISVLSQFGCPIDFLYLDSFDYDIYHPDPSQQHHLREIQAAYPYLSEKCVIMIDDCALSGGGKGKLVIEFLLMRGWKIVKNSYQVILTR